MNKKRREELNGAIKLLNSAAAIVGTACTMEQDCLDNLPENLQYSERCEKMEEAADNLGEACDRIDEAIDKIEEAKKYIQLAIRS